MMGGHSPGHLDDGALGSRVYRAGIAAEDYDASVEGFRSTELEPVCNLRPLTDDMLIIEPHPCFLISGIA